MMRIAVGRLKSLLLAVLFSFIAAVASAEPADLMVMSFNVRFAKGGHSEDAAENNWTDAQHPRRDRTIRVIRDANPDLLGVQEARDEQINDLRHAFPEY